MWGIGCESYAAEVISRTRVFDSTEIQPVEKR